MRPALAGALALAVPGDPREDAHAMERVSFVMQEGRGFPRPGDQEWTARARRLPHSGSRSR